MTDTEVRAALKTALYAVLHDKVKLGEATVLVANHIPQETELPYVEMGNAVKEDISCHLDEAGWAVQVDIDIWSDYSGDAEADAIAGSIEALLEAWTPSVAGYSFGSFELAIADAAPEPEAEVRHCLVRVTAEMYEV